MSNIVCNYEKKVASLVKSMLEVGISRAEINSMLDAEIDMLALRAKQ